MAKGKAIFIVKKYPYNHPDEDEPAPVGAEVDLSHLAIEQRIHLVDRGLMEPTTKNALEVPSPPEPEEEPKLNKYGLPFGQVPKGKAKPVKEQANGEN